MDLSKRITSLSEIVNLYNVKSPLSLVERSIFGTVAKLTEIGYLYLPRMCLPNQQQPELGRGNVPRLRVLFPLIRIVGRQDLNFFDISRILER